MKTVIVDENLHKLSFFETSWSLTIEKPSFSMYIKHTGAHHHPMYQNFANFISIGTILVLD